MKRLAGWMLASPATLAITFLLVIPVAITVGLSFGSPGQGDWGIVQPYADFFASGFRRNVLWRTFTVAGWVTVISLAAGLATAYVVARCPPWMKSTLIVLAVFPLLTGVVVRSFAWLVLLGREGMVNQVLQATGLTDGPVAMLYTQGAVIVAMVYIFVPLMVLVLVGVLENIPEDLLQASSSLGAGPVAGFFQITLPLAVPGLIVGAVLVFTASFTSYATPHLLGGTRQMMMGTFLQQRALVAFDWPGAAVVAAIMLAVIVATVLVMTRVARRLNPMAT
ncbi:ABC transporter permease [Pararhodobacter aggregans]|uniref:Spermidine/putrescine ABC transporter permease n=1 Tax=Pararhodobacter aggregans TaxID=404875 RepID=A0A2T7USC0_9RHOB|nr:ABC transporter permease [Pararhodobacter aggregans]PTX00160.1 putative spermidine/putrescine transport system permease protein [Pararhodobacter aggregans]PVE47488.1 spermidine/putrescine ABC transporter permease [Pararhodobacter aggregans]